MSRSNIKGVILYCLLKLLVVFHLREDYSHPPGLSGRAGELGGEVHALFALGVVKLNQDPARNSIKTQKVLNRDLGMIDFLGTNRKRFLEVTVPAKNKL